MKKPSTSSEKLSSIIDSLEWKVKDQEGIMKSDANDLMENLKPSTLLKNAVQNVFENRDSRRAAITAGIGMASVAIIRQAVMTNLSGSLSSLMSKGIHMVMGKFKKKHNGIFKTKR